MLTRVMNQLKEGGANAELQLLGVVMTMFDGRTRPSHQVVDEVRGFFGDKVFETVIPRTTRLAEAPSHGKPIIAYDPYSAGAAAYEILAQEVAERLSLRSDPTQALPASPEKPALEAGSSAEVGSPSQGGVMDEGLAAG